MAPFRRGSKFPIKKMVEDYAKGMSLHEIQDKYQVSAGNLYNYLCAAGVMRSPSLAHCRDRWLKLTKIKKSKTRLISVSSELLRNAGFNPSCELVGKWHVLDKLLILEIKEAET